MKGVVFMSDKKSRWSKITKNEKSELERRVVSGELHSTAAPKGAFDIVTNGCGILSNESVANDSEDEL